ncbi:hypothetical protein BDP27DRAFT_1331996, partial [Rhodocollybia butyracea]
LLLSASAILILGPLPVLALLRSTVSSFSPVVPWLSASIIAFGAVFLHTASRMASEYHENW